MYFSVAQISNAIKMPLKVLDAIFSRRWLSQDQAPSRASLSPRGQLSTGWHAAGPRVRERVPTPRSAELRTSERCSTAGFREGWNAYKEVRQGKHGLSHIIFLGALLVLSQSAQAAFFDLTLNDLPNSTLSNWNYNGNWAAGDSASHLASPFTSMPGGYPLTNSDGGCGPSKPCLKVNGDVLEFFIPNFVDSLPLKEIVIQYIFDRSAFPNPGVTIAIAGSDPTATVLAQRLIDPFFDTNDFLGNGPLFILGRQEWALTPNPDWERITLTGATSAGLREVRISTISIPEPATLLLMGVALLGLGFSRRRA